MRSHVELAEQVGDLGVRRGDRGLVGVDGGLGLLADHVHFKVFAVSSASTSTTTSSVACWASSAAFTQLSMKARVGATLRIGGNGDAAAPALRGPTGRRTAA